MPHRTKEAPAALEAQVLRCKNDSADNQGADAVAASRNGVNPNTLATEHIEQYTGVLPALNDTLPKSQLNLNMPLNYTDSMPFPAVSGNSRAATHDALRWPDLPLTCDSGGRRCYSGLHVRS